MRRREFIKLIGGAATVWPIGARAQHTGKLPRLGYLSDEPPNPNAFHSRDYILATFRRKIEGLGPWARIARGG